MAQPGDSLNDFGLMISFLLPGMSSLFGLSYLFPELGSWFDLSSLNSMSIASMVFMVLIAIGTGLIVQTIRWLLIDSLHHVTGLRHNDWDFAKFTENLEAFDELNENHYRYYQFYAGMVIAMTLTLFIRCYSLESLDSVNLGIIALILLMFAGSRNTLRKYYSRLDDILTRA